ncbi:MAG TPA: YeeE/YedE family protein [Casimicrobiaceae bacterium]|nr:YeeE/YedE family protein [Casimicrobiaceae bacterium]
MKRALPIIASGIVGLVFGIGLIVSGMFNPAKVLAFLDLAGAWDPSLALVMVGAVAAASIGFAMAGRRGTTLLGATLQLSSARNIDRRLVLGSLAFGVGWGLVGFCPGPALVALGTGHIKAFVFVAGMIAGMLAFEVAERRRKSGLENVAPEQIHPTTADG